MSICTYFCSWGAVEPETTDSEVHRYCGEGSTAHVHVERRKGDSVAVKVYRTGVVAWHEVNIMRKLEHHPCLPSLIEIGTDRIIMTYGGSQCLVDWILSPTSRADRAACDSIAWDIASALQHMHNRRVAHLDVKADNIIIDAVGRATLVDFDLSHVYRPNESEFSLRCHRGSPAYVPPEMVWRSESGISGFRADVWSFGIVFLALCFKRMPFHSASPPCDLFRRFMALLRFETPFVALCQLHPMFAQRGDLTRGHKEIIDATLRRDPRHRSTFSEIISWIPTRPETCGLPSQVLCSSSVRLLRTMTG